MKGQKCQSGRELWGRGACLRSPASFLLPLILGLLALMSALRVQAQTFWHDLLPTDKLPLAISTFSHRGGRDFLPVIARD
jgi:hypothetical protein